MTKLLLLSAILLTTTDLSLEAADAKANWKEHCAKCHGADGKGKTKMGRKLHVKDYTDAKVQSEMKEEKMAKTIAEGIKEDGKTRMTPYDEKLKPEEIQALVKFIRDFAKSDS